MNRSAQISTLLISIWLAAPGCTSPNVEKAAGGSTSGEDSAQAAPTALRTTEPEPFKPAEPPPEPTRASQSVYNRDITKARTSVGLTKADIAWHALNTYGWDCEEVVSRGPQEGDYYVVTCANGTKLRVYPRQGEHPRITNARGSYD